MKRKFKQLTKLVIETIVEGVHPLNSPYTDIPSDVVPSYSSQFVLMSSSGQADAAFGMRKNLFAVYNIQRSELPKPREF